MSSNKDVLLRREQLSRCSAYSDYRLKTVPAVLKLFSNLLMNGRTTPIYEFDSFRLDVAERFLLQDGRIVPLTTKAFETLLMLVRNSHRVIEKDELMKNVWHDTFVTEANLSQTIFMLRKALGESRHERRYIETIQKRGYRFITTVRELRKEEDESNYARAQELSRDTFDSSIRSLAILPFVNASSDPAAEYLSDGITESLINSLSSLPGVRIMARSTVFRYKGREVDTQRVGRELNVRAVLVGRVLQSGDRLIISAELVDVSDGSQLWGEQYNRNLTDILAVQEEISRIISEKLRLKLSGADQKLLMKRYTDNITAYQLYLKGRYFWSKYTEDGAKKSIRYFSEAIKLDAQYALAYAGLSDSYYRLSNLYLPPREALSKAKAAALKAVKLDEKLAEAHTSLAFIRLYCDWNWHEGERELKRAIELNPGYATARHRYGTYLSLIGRFDESLAELKLAQELDPLSLPINLGIAANFWVSRQYEQAIEQLRKLLEMEPGFYMAHGLLGIVYAQQHKFPQAVAEIETALALDNTQVLLRFLGHTYAISGQTDAAYKVLKELHKLSGKHYVSPYSKAVIYAGLGERDHALALLEDAYEDKSEGLSLLKVSPELDNLRSDSRFVNLMQRVGFAA